MDSRIVRLQNQYRRIRDTLSPEVDTLFKDMFAVMFDIDSHLEDAQKTAANFEKLYNAISGRS